MNEIISVPYLGVNDSDCTLISKEVSDGAFVEKDMMVCIVETTKSTFEIFSHSGGYIYFTSNVGETLHTKEVIAVVTPISQDNPIAFINQVMQEMEKSEKEKNEGSVITKKAEMIINNLGLDKNKILERFLGSKITESMVREYVDSDEVNSYRKGFIGIEKIIIIGGVSGGGALIVADSISKNNKQRAVCILDQNKEYLGKEILGIPVSGTIEDLQKWIDEGKADSVIIAFNRNLKEREKIYTELENRNIKFTNVIDPSADIRAGVNIGKGNVILAHTYLGASTIVGNNNFISANVCIEHGNILGSHCAFGPGVFTSGNVTIGNGIRFGTGIFIEPGIEIGHHAVISSGSIITDHIREGEVVGKHKANT